MPLVESARPQDLTNLQIVNAPHGAYYVGPCPTWSWSYGMSLCHWLGRGDLVLLSPFDVPDQIRRVPRRQIVVDHRTELTHDQRAFVERHQDRFLTKSYLERA